LRNNIGNIDLIGFQQQTGYIMSYNNYIVSAAKKASSSIMNFADQHRETTTHLADVGW
jgi:hypothetical protein